MLDNLKCQSVLLIIIIVVGQGPTVLAVSSDGDCFEIFFSPLSYLFSFFHSLRDGLI